MSLSIPRLTGHQKDLIRSALATGCDRVASAKAASATLQELNNELQLDEEFAKTVLKAEGGAVFHRMNALHHASKDPKQWRAAAWWLEQESKRQSARLKAEQVTAGHWLAYGKDVVHAVMATVSQAMDREALVNRLCAIFKIRDLESVSEEGNSDDESTQASDAGTDGVAGRGPFSDGDASDL